MAITTPCTPKQQSFNAGEDKTVTIYLTLTDASGVKKPFNITGATEIVALMTAPTPVVKKLSLSQITILNPGAGIIAVAVLNADSILMSGDINVEARVTLGGLVSIAQVPSAFTVNASLFPGI